MLPRSDDQAGARLLRRGFALEYATLGWNVVREVFAPPVTEASAGS